ncbi:MAG: DUF4426 domain-containing protein [Aliidiomarina sp.]|uniref:DUF4426 domain-containing protein n=1 Tax=Aliidiomarina sp. TaxID=1872439 RepID=UPI0025B7AB44|nr:DUF4426 domain-containing protein [Aliidiomarina sp.]MCH8502154.1 DUF4426 domain-containing protein [Aliidiomarina sp.]
MTQLKLYRSLLCKATTIAWIVTLVVLMLLSWQAHSQTTTQTSEPQGGQFVELGDWEVHYIAFASTFLQADIANRYNIRRSNARGLVNISVLDASREDKPALRAQIQGYALNSAGQRQELQFRRFIEEPAIYFISEVRHSDDDRIRFFITIRHGDETRELRFTHTFYRD